MCDIAQDVFVLFLRRLAVPIEVRRIVAWHLDAGAAGKDRILLRPTATQNQIFHTIDVIQLSCMYVSVEDDQLHVLRVSRDSCVRIVRLWNGAETGAAEDRIMKGDEHPF